MLNAVCMLSSLLAIKVQYCFVIMERQKSQNLYHFASSSPLATHQMN